uniref:Ribosomal protein S20 n=1 Tax=Callithamnion tetricum TaxID=193179 RepID=A0A4D6WQN1_9FLOR|nr:ribosomal protein S20 [Callithamnion tetricum]
MSKNLSAIKRSSISLRNYQRNKIYKSIIKTFTKKYVTEISKNSSQDINTDTAFNSLGLVYQKIDKAVKRGVWHKNKGARKKARLAKLLKK